jgi:hypothetical protein
MSPGPQFEFQFVADIIVRDVDDVILDIASGLRVRRRMERISGTVNAAALWE